MSPLYLPYISRTSPLQVRIAPGHPKLLGTDPVTGHALHHYQIAVDRGLPYEEACRMLRDKAVQNGGQLFRHEGFMRRRQPWCGTHVVVLLLQQPAPAWCIDPRPIFKVWKPNLGRSGESWGIGEVLHRPPESAYAPVTPEAVREPWEQQFHASGRLPSGVPGARMEEKHVLTGAVLPFWGAISQVVGSKQ